MLSLVLIVSELTEVTAHLNEDLPRRNVPVRSIWQQYLATHLADLQRTVPPGQHNGINVAESDRLRAMANGDKFVWLRTKHSEARGLFLVHCPCWQFHSDLRSHANSVDRALTKYLPIEVI